MALEAGARPGPYGIARGRRCWTQFSKTNRRRCRRSLTLGWSRRAPTSRRSIASSRPASWRILTIAGKAHATCCANCGGLQEVQRSMEVRLKADPEAVAI